MSAMIGIGEFVDMIIQPYKLSGTPAKSPHEIHDEGNHEDQTDQATANRGTTKEKTTSAEKDQKHNE